MQSVSYGGEVWIGLGQDAGLLDHKAAHAVPQQDDVRIGRFVGREPFAEVDRGEIKGLVSLVSWVDLGVDDVRVQGDLEEVVDVCGE